MNIVGDGMDPVGVAWSGVSILNAIGAGYGGAIGIELPLYAYAMPGEGVSGYSNYGDIGEEILKAIHSIASRIIDLPGFHVRVESLIPPARGLKSSSALVNAILEAVLRLGGLDPSPIKVAGMGVEAARKAGITITGAYDDSLASKMPGAHITDNTRLRLITTYRLERKPIILLVPGEENPITGVDASAFRKYKDLYMEAYKRAVTGRLREAIILNTKATLKATGGWDKWPLIEEVLNLRDTWASGVSGKGPALFAITKNPRSVMDYWKGHGNLILTHIRG